MTTPFQPLPCAAGGGGAADAVDVEGTLVCDVNAAGEVVGTALVEAVYDDAGVRTGTRLVNVLDGTVYVPVGTVQPCREGCCPEPVVLCDVQPDGSSVQFIRSYTGDETGAVESADTLLDGSPFTPTGTVGSCDPYRLCTPLSDVNLNGDCGLGETPNTAIIGAEGVASDSVVNDDPSADPLCGGVWDRPSEPSPFTVLETFRNATFDQPGPVTQGSAPYAGLTASPGWTGSNVDVPGSGWLQTSDINSATNGIWQVPNPFSTADGMTAQVTFASHDGTITPNGDGMAFVFTNGGVPPQSSPIGGGGSLGLGNWQGGYAAIVLDEYGGTGAGPNTISIQGAGPTATTFAAPPINVAPHSISADTDRPNPGRLITSIIEEGGQTYISASILWSGDTEPTLYYNRVNVTPTLGPSPATLRMSLYGGSGGAFRSEHEYRDATATAAGSQQWRAFPIVTDPIPACVTSVRVEACVDVTFTEDTQTVGNGNPEAFLWLVNTATNTVLDKIQRSSQPSQVGTANTMCVDAVVPVAQLPNLRVYVGAETRDSFGIYGSSWENLEITVAGLGCPVTPVRTLAISAPCPIDVNIIGGTADGTPAPVTVVNTPSTFEDAPVCLLVGGNTFNGFRREVRAPDGTVTVTFLGTDGLPVTPDQWTPGVCAPGDTELLQLCDNGTDPATPFVRRVTYNDAGEVVSAEDVNYIGTPYVPVGAVGPCAGASCASLVLGEVCVTSDALPGVVLPAVVVQSCEDGSVTYLNPGTGEAWPGTSTVVVCPPDNQLWEEILCDVGAGGARFRRVYTLTPLGSVVLYDETLDGALWATVGPVEACSTEATSTIVQEMCDQTGISTTIPFYRIITFDADGNELNTADYAADGLPYTVVGTARIGHCDADRIEHEILCDMPSGVQFLRTWRYTTESALPSGFNDYTLDGITPYVVVGAAGKCEGCISCQTLTLCDFGADVPVLITGISTGGTLSNGVTWSGARGSAVNFNPQHNNVDGSWWGMAAFPNSTVAPDTWFFDRPVDVEFSVVIAHSFGTGSGPVNQVQVPIGSELISSAADYSYDVATGIVTVDSSNNGDCTKVTNPTVANSARFLLRNVTQFTLDFLGQRIAICAQFSNWRFGSIAVTPATTTFLRTICRDCDGVVATVTDTEADGTTPYVPIGPVGECGTPADAEPQCFATQICVQPQGVEEFISNEANLTSTVAVPNIDPVWQWSNDPVLGPWFNMYDVGVFPGWITVDPGTTQGVANWVAPHPNSSPNTSGLPGEGPTIGAGNANWYARAQFTLPANADPSSIRIAATVINADQLGVEFRLNSGAWQPVNASHVDPAFSFPAQVIPGAQAGLNQVFVHVQETVFGSGAAGVKMHLIASYNLGDQQSWTQIVCDDGTVSYFTNAGEQTDALPEDWVIVPCAGASSSGSTCCPVVVAEVCLANGHPGVIIRNEDGTLTRADTITGLTFADVDVVSCAPTINAQARLLTAAQVWTPGTDVIGTLTGITVTGLTGTYNLVDQSGTAVGPLAAGVSIGWNNDEEGPLQGPQSITAAAASTVLVAWTQR